MNKNKLDKLKDTNKNNTSENQIWQKCGTKINEQLSVKLKQTQKNLKALFKTFCLLNVVCLLSFRFRAIP